MLWLVTIVIFAFFMILPVHLLATNYKFIFGTLTIRKVRIWWLSWVAVNFVVSCLLCFGWWPLTLAWVGANTEVSVVTLILIVLAVFLLGLLLPFAQISVIVIETKKNRLLQSD